MTLMPSTTHLMLRKPRSGCLEARTAPMQSHFSGVRQFPCSLEGRDLSSRRSEFSSYYIALAERSSFVLRNDIVVHF
jgi:hypothetical protein